MIRYLSAFALRMWDRFLWFACDAKWRPQFGHVGTNFVYDPVSSRFVTPDKFFAGNDCFFNADAHVSGYVEVGDRVLVGPSVKLLSGNHIFGLKGFYPRFLRHSLENPERLEHLVIENDCWVGANSLILGGVRVGQGCVIGAASVVTKDVPPFTIVAGAPAKPIRRIFDDGQLREHLSALGEDAEAIDAILERRRSGGGESLPVWQTDQSSAFYYNGELVTGPQN